jgi:hypothetical protein
MKLVASLIALAALAVAAGSSPAVAGRSAHVSGSRVVIVQQRPLFVRPISPFLVARPRPLFLSRPLVVERPFLAGQPVIVQPQIVVPRSSFFFITPGTVVIVR